MNDLAELTERLAPAIAAAEAILEEEVQRRVGEIAIKQAQPIRDRDAKISVACAKIADAVEEIQQARFAGGPEIPARKRLERACNDLYKVMRGRPR